MGAFYTNITVRGPEQSQVLDFLKEQGRAAFVSPTVDGCTVVYDQECESQDEKILKGLASKLSAHFGCPTLSVLVHDDDILLYWLYQGGKRIDQYNSAPGYFTGVNRKPSGGNAEVLCEAFDVKQKVEEVRQILHAKESDDGDWPLTMAAMLKRAEGIAREFKESGRQELDEDAIRKLVGDGYNGASERHEHLARVLGLPSFSVNLGYDYIERGDWTEFESDKAHPVHTDTDDEENST